MKCVCCQRGAVDNISQPGSIHLDLAVALDTQTHTTSQPHGWMEIFPVSPNTLAIHRRRPPLCIRRFKLI